MRFPYMNKEFETSFDNKYQFVRENYVLIGKSGIHFNLMNSVFSQGNIG
jgi:hypothetical protein